MIRPDQIPDEVVEAAVTAWLESASDYTRLNKSICAAIAAALNAWPDGEIHNFDGTHFAEAIVLPLPEEASDE